MIVNFAISADIKVERLQRGLASACCRGVLKGELESRLLWDTMGCNVLDKAQCGMCIREP